VTIKRQHEGAGLFMDLELFSKHRPIELFGQRPPRNWRFLQPRYPLLQGKVKPVIHPLFEWKPQMSKLEWAAIRALYEPRELRDDLLAVLDLMGAGTLADRWSHSKPPGFELAQAVSSKDQLDRLEEQLRVLTDEWWQSIRLATQYTNNFNKLTAVRYVKWDDGEPPASIRNEWGIRLLTKGDRELEPVRLDPIALRQRW
jgi:hypothetical protein